MWVTGAFVLGEVTAYWSGKMAEYGGKTMSFSILIPAVFLCAAYLAALILKAGFRTARLLRPGPTPLFAALLLALFWIGFGRMAWEMGETPLESFLAEGGPQNGVQAEGVIESVREKEGVYSLTLADASVTVGDRTFERQRLMVTVDGGKAESRFLTQLCEGRWICVIGKLEAFQPARNPGEFDYRLYYRGLKLRCRLRAKQATLCGGAPSLFQSQVSRFRSFVKHGLEELCRGEDAGIFCAVLLGDKSELSDEISTLFGDSGIAHILAVSGLHVSLIGMSLYGGLRKAGFGYGKAGLVSAAVLFFYGSVAGYGPSVFRAVFMVFCAFLAAWLGKTYDLLSAMALSLLLLAADSPYLLFGAGLQLSYGAVAAIGLENSRAQPHKVKKPPERAEGGPEKVIAALRMSLMIQLATLPIVLYHFFRFPVWGIVLNLIVIPLMSYAAGSGLLSVGVYAVSRFLSALPLPVLSFSLSNLFYHMAYGLIGPGHFIFSLYRGLCGLARKLPFASLAAGRPDGWKIALYYSALACLYLCSAGSGDDGKMSALCSFQEKGKKTALFAASVFLLCTRPVRGLEVWFLDVGQGDGVWIQTREISVLSDCGSSQYRNVGRDRLVPFLESRGVTEIDYVLISHGDSDHVNGIAWLLEEEPEIRVDCLVMPQAGKGEDVYESLESLAASRGTKVRYMQRGEQITAGQLTLNCLNPAVDGGEERNGHSLVFAAQYRDYSMLLTGDIGEEQERNLLASGDFSPGCGETVRTSVLKAAHHGSATSTCEAFLEAVNPGAAILSYGEGNTYGHPSEAVVERLKRQGVSIWRTAVSGAVRIRTDGSRMKIRGFLPKRVDRKGEDGL